MIETTVIPKKRPYGSNDLGLMGNPNTSHSDQNTSSKKFISPTKLGPAAGLYEGMDSGLHQRYVWQLNLTSFWWQHSSLAIYLFLIFSGPSLFASSLSSKLGIPLPNPAPEIDIAPPPPTSSLPMGTGSSNISSVPGMEAPQFEDPDEPKKKKYAKEAWPGKKPTPSLL